MPTGTAGPPEAGAPPAEAGDPNSRTFVLLSSTPEPMAVDVDPASDLVLEFSVDVSPGEGTIVVMSGGAPVETVGAADPRVSIAGPTARIDLDVVLGSATEYALVIARDAFVNPVGAGLLEDQSLSFTTAGVAFHGAVSSGLSLWLDASYAPSLKQADGAVRLWADRSGKHHLAIQDDPARRPELVSNGVNDGPSLSFDGSNDVLLAPAPAASTSYEGFIVWETMLAAGTAKTLLLGSEGAFEVALGHTSSSRRRTVSVWAGDDPTSAPLAAPAPNASTLWNFTASTTPPGLYARSQGGAPRFVPLEEQAAMPTLPLSIGAAPDGDAALLSRIAEVLFFERSLSSAERIAIVDDLRAKWGVADPVCEPDHSLGPDGSCFFVTEALPWDEAEVVCSAVGAGWHLASIRSEQENEFVFGLIDEPSWLSGNNSASAEVWLWSEDGAPFWSGDSTGGPLNGAFTNWRSGSPSVDGCVLMHAETAPGRWDVDGCSDAYPAVCQGPGG